MRTQNRILKLREAYKDATAYDAYTPTEVTPNPPSIPDIKLQVSPYNNISVTICNFMRHAPNYFRKGQLEKMFILFADPHFKQQNHRRRIINANFLSLYAYILKEGGMLYMITDVKDLFDWNLKYLEAHPLFERIPDSELVDDPCMYVMANETEEGKKVTRINGDKYPAVFRRIKGE